MELVISLPGTEKSLRLERSGERYHITLDATRYEVDVVQAGDGVFSLIIDGAQYEVAVNAQKTGPRGSAHYQVTSSQGLDNVSLVDPLTHLAQQSRGGSGGDGSLQVAAYMPGQVVEILVSEGDTVQPGQGVLVLEAMKMKNEIQAETAGVVSKLHVTEGQAVEADDPLFEIGAPDDAS